MQGTIIIFHENECPMCSQKMFETLLKNCSFYEIDDLRFSTVRISLDMFFTKFN